MKTIEMKVDYAGSEVNINIQPEESCAGTIYPVETNGRYAFTFLEDDEGEWSIMREADANVPVIESELYNAILNKLHYEIMYVA
ncbi:MAG: hypothetical protein ACKVOM_09360 [Ferruginibacter sp.]